MSFKSDTMTQSLANKPTKSSSYFSQHKMLPLHDMNHLEWWNKFIPAQWIGLENELFKSRKGPEKEIISCINVLHKTGK